MSSWLERFLTRHIGGVPKKLSDLQWILRVNPKHPPILTEAHTFRTISPASQPAYSPPVNDKISKNYYFKRDLRRQYPQPIIMENLLSDKSVSAPPNINKRYKYKEGEKMDHAGNLDFSIRLIR